MSRSARWWWSAYARCYDRLWDGVLTDDLAGEIARRLPPGPVPLLDAGTGTGLVAVRLAGAASAVGVAGPGAVVGMDASRAMLARAAARPGVWLAGDARWPPLRTASFGAVVAANLVHCCAEPEEVLAALVELVWPGGRLVVTWPADEVGPWRLCRAERDRGTADLAAVGRMAVRLLIAVIALGTRSVRRTPDALVLGVARSVADARGLDVRHCTVLGGLQHLVVLTRPNAATPE